MSYAKFERWLRHPNEVEPLGLEMKSLDPVQSEDRMTVFWTFTEGYKHSLDNAHSIAFSQCNSNKHLIEDETFNDSDIISNLTDYENGHEEPDSLRADTIYALGFSFPTNRKSIFLK
ncbi:uncharacterized protein TNCV_4868931 [Trichonephila clavipes]|nr:uncharacterized protein TNCV_4868931 [Trichonephila clavipes]